MLLLLLDSYFNIKMRKTNFQKANVAVLRESEREKKKIIIIIIISSDI